MKAPLPPQFDGLSDRVTFLLAEYRTAVYVAIAAGALAVFTGRLGIPAVPSVVGLGLRIIAVGIVPATAGAYLVVDRYVPDPRQNILILNPTDDGYTVGTAKVPSDLWDAREHEDNKPVMRPAGPFDAIVTRLEFDSELGRLTVEGANPEVADPVEVIAKNGKLNETFGELEAAAADLERIKATATTRERRVEKKIINAVIGAVETGSSIKPGLAEGEIFAEVFEDIEEGERPVDESRDDEPRVRDRDRKQNGHDETDGDPTDAILDQVL